jgi:hypothetical protein
MKLFFDNCLHHAPLPYKGQTLVSVVCVQTSARVLAQSAWPRVEWPPPRSASHWSLLLKNGFRPLTTNRTHNQRQQKQQENLCMQMFIEGLEENKHSSILNLILYQRLLCTCAAIFHRKYFATAIFHRKYFATAIFSPEVLCDSNFFTGSTLRQQLFHRKYFATAIFCCTLFF